MKGKNGIGYFNLSHNVWSYTGHNMCTECEDFDSTFFVMPTVTRKHFIDFMRSSGMAQSPQDFALLFTDLCTDREIHLILERWTIAKLLHMGFPYREIARKTGASASTISKVALKLQRKATLRGVFDERAEKIRESLDNS